ncbi:hypothetical protein LG634_36430 [Streptomyces bambusae]|uniref:hypothetical protein n=1 Tax=Streptomyces bambusae TaxID=1550616 RepID=UPI001D001889|nr:hypothetical protein [Streptomyces bambusae]MCB5170271.1 hypothetical protein [Streptomyces bambusae]
MDREVTSTDGATSALRLTGSTKGLLAITKATFDMADHAFNLYRQRAVSPY